MTDHAPADKLDQWERAFAGGLMANSRTQTRPWLAGHIYVARDVPPQREHVRTEQGPHHSFILFTERAKAVEDRTEGGPVHYRAARPGDLHVYSRARSEQPHLSRWQGPVSFISVALEPHVALEACRAAGIDYQAAEFLDRFPARDPLLEHLIRQLGAELQAGAPNGRLYGKQLMQMTAAHLVRHHTAEAHRINERAGGLPGVRLRRVEEYVEAHLAGDVALEDLAGAAGDMNPYHFSRLFRQSTGVPPYQYVIERRVEEAKRLLRETNLPIMQVAFAVGYSSQSHFTTLFRRRVGITPGAYRKVRC